MSSWERRIERVLEKGDARVRKGDDYAARLWVNFVPEEQLGLEGAARARMFELFSGRELPGRGLNSSGPTAWKWGRSSPVLHTDRLRLVVLRSGNQRAGDWVREEVNITAPYNPEPSKEPSPVQSLAVMTDSDGTGETVWACCRTAEQYCKKPSAEQKI